ncbi:MAG: 2-isopropylmalate synthase [Chloroflexi bacterium]|nr:2-isopropylmalate synthase [Chloroflexota bacterium]
MDRVIIFDTSLRDGEQSPGATYQVEEKLEIARQLARLGVDVIEAGFPISSQGDFEAVRRIASEVDGPVICGLARVYREDVDRAWEAVKGARRPRIHVFVGVSEIHLQYQTRMTREQALEMAVAMVKRAKSYTPDVEFSPMDATRADPAYVVQICKAAVDAGATTLNIADTCGYAYPQEFYNFIKMIRERTLGDRTDVVISVHCHDDLGMATANSLAGVMAGARQVEGCVNGIGERAGNTALEEVIMALHTRHDYFGLTTNIDTAEIYRTSRLISQFTGLLVQPNKAVVGANAFAHESGIHQDGVLKERTTFEIMDPRDVGLPSNQIILGKLSGRAGFRHRLEQLGYRLNKEHFQRAFQRFKDLGDRKKIITDRDLEVIIADEVQSVREAYRLQHVQVTCGDPLIPTATVRVHGPGGETYVETTTGTGPVDAVYKALDQVVHVPNELVEYQVHSVTGGMDAVGEVTVRVASGGHTFVGRGASTDIIVASARAYLNALNKIVAERAATAPQAAHTA